LYSQLGVSVNSVETLVITSVAGATNPYVLNKVANAEMIWFAGGDQYNYVSYFKDNALEDLINQHVTTKHAPIGGTSAGMAILGGKYFSAQNGTVTSAQAMSNPYASNVTLEGYNGTPTNSFLNVPFLGSVITDTHYDNPDRRGRHATFMARFKILTTIYGIACNEYVAVCIGNDGKAKVYGDYPNYQEFAYFIQPNCNIANAIENCVAGQPLTWNFGGQALKVYKVPGTMNGTNYFDVNNWENGIGAGGTWEHWSVNNGVFASAAGSAPNCTLGNVAFNSQEIDTTPNPFSDFLRIENAENATVELFDSLGKKLFLETNFTSNTIDTSNFSNGLYFLKVIKDGTTLTKKVIKQ
jgi:cyanophycinase-like exopeptidase